MGTPRGAGAGAGALAMAAAVEVPLREVPVEVGYTSSSSLVTSTAEATVAAPPVSLAALMKQRLGLAAALDAPTPALRKVEQKPLFANFDESAYLIRAPTHVMRLVDALRFHKPTREEREELNLSTAQERLYLHALNDILLACGARKGFRFTSHDILRLRQVTEEIAQRYDVLDHAFKHLPLEVTQFKFPSSIRRIEDERPWFEQEVAGKFTPMESGCASVGITSGRTGTDKDVVVPCSVLSALNDPAGVAIARQAFHFQWLAREYIMTFAQLRDIVVCIRQRFRMYLNAKTLPPPETFNEPTEAEFEAKILSPFPAFLYVLIQKYHLEERQNTEPWTPSQPEPPVESIGSLAVYVTRLLLHEVPLTSEELSSLEVMLQVVKLSYEVDYVHMKITHIAWPPTHPIPHPATNVVTSSTLARLLYEFLANVHELRLISREKDALSRCKRSKKQPEQQQPQEKRQRHKAPIASVQPERPCNRA